jgi:predicted metal-binding protein
VLEGACAASVKVMFFFVLWLRSCHVCNRCQYAVCVRCVVLGISGVWFVIVPRERVMPAGECEGLSDREWVSA